MNPQTGEILAMVSTPTYENNRLARFIPDYYYRQLEADPAHPLINHAISSPFPPGSTFKLVTAIGALNEGVVSPTEQIFDPGTITIANRYYPTDPGRAKEFFCWLRESWPGRHAAGIPSPAASISTWSAAPGRRGRLDRRIGTTPGAAWL
jgi:penicillin-binding protein 2